MTERCSGGDHGGDLVEALCRNSTRIFHSRLAMTKKVVTLDA